MDENQAVDRGKTYFGDLATAADNNSERRTLPSCSRPNSGSRPWSLTLVTGMVLKEEDNGLLRHVFSCIQHDNPCKRLNYQDGHVKRSI